MATTTIEQMPSTPTNMQDAEHSYNDDPDIDNRSYQHRFSRFALEPLDLSDTASPSQVKRTIEVHLQETDRRLLDTQKLGNALLKQREDLTSRLEEVDQLQDDAQIPADLRRRLADIDREHSDVAREVARALIGPKSKQEDLPLSESSVFSSQATGSPTKVSAPSRRHRNQPSTRAGDLQFAADISTSLLAQVRQLQAAVAERDITIKHAIAERETSDNDILAYTQKIRALDESEQRYKDENWNLETQNHELRNSLKELQDKEKRLNLNLASTVAERNKLQNELDELTLAHGKLSEEHLTTKKAHDTEIHGLKRSADMADTERQLLQDRIDELVAQNQELAKAVTSRFRTGQADHEGAIIPLHEQTSRALDLSDDSPPPSPTKATPRPGGLESETLRSSLHHAHRMIQNLKGNIHREKTEKIELKRMLQDARDELEQKRGADGSAAKRPKSKPEVFKKPARSDMLGGGRRARTDVEFIDDDWEDHHADTPTNARSGNFFAPNEHPHQRLTDASDAYQTAEETEGMFDTADERNTTESEAFMTGAESLAGDSTDELTETEGTASKPQGHRSARMARISRNGGNQLRMSGAYPTSADELDDLDDLQTPIQSSYAKFKLRNRPSSGRQADLISNNTPESFKTRSVSADSPATTITAGQSPYSGEQTLFSELEGMGEMNSDTQSTPARSMLSSQHSTPAILATPSMSVAASSPSVSRPKMVDSSTMTDEWLQNRASRDYGLQTDHDKLVEDVEDAEPLHTLLAAATFPLPPSAPVSPVRKADHSTQYTPQRGLAESPVRPGSSYITPPKTVWDEVHEPVTPTPVLSSQPEIRRPPLLGFSSVLSHDSEPDADLPRTPKDQQPTLTFSSITSDEIEPATPTHPVRALSADSALADVPETPRTPEQALKGSRGVDAGQVLGGGLLASAAAALGFAVAKSEVNTQPTEETRNSAGVPRTMVDTATSPLRPITGETRHLPGAISEADPLADKLSERPSSDQASQTLLTAGQLDEALQRRDTNSEIFTETQPENSLVKRTTSSPNRFSARPTSRNRGIVTIDEGSSLAGPSSMPQRPGSASSNRASSFVSQQHPPLPPDHKDVIARANSQVGSPTKRDSSMMKVGGIMGPPALPASAMRRPRTPSGTARSPTRESRGKQGTVSSQMSRRSSVSSFASELDERFNIRPDAHRGGSYESGGDTDPRMIQAITQTMIGEFLWKYTRKAGSKEMSSTRHRRYFWVHPYTKTLYWSDRDPQAAGRSELKAKSVAILSVRVVSDDNPMPPGLHRKSLEITTPGRVVKFTASTGQRHETWFNALSYLLNRGEGDGSKNDYAPNGSEITQDDLAEFSLGGYGARLVPNGGRMSMSSYNSRTTRNTSKNRTMRQSLPGGMGTLSSQNSHTEGMQPSSAHENSDTIRRSRADQAQHSDRENPMRSNSMVRISKMFGSVTGRTRSEVRAGPSQSRETSSIYDASIVSEHRRDEEEAAARRQKQKDNNAGLEDVRACCDGKHNVSTLTHRPSSTSNTQGRVNSVINRSMSRRF